MNTAKALIGAVVCVGGLCAAGTVWWKLTRVTYENDPIAYSIMVSTPKYRALTTSAPAEADLIYGEFARAYVSGLDAPPAHTGVDKTAPVSDISWNGSRPISHADLLPPGLRPSITEITPAMHDALLRQASGLIRARFASVSADEYLAFRARFGSVLPDTEGFESRNYTTIGDVVRYQLGREPNEQDTVGSMFLFLFEKHQSDGTFALREIGIGDGLAVAYGVHDGSNSTAALDDAPLGFDGWYGGISHTYGVWTASPQRAKDIVAEHGTVPSADVGAILFFESGSPRPLVLTFVWNPSRSDWQLESAAITNYIPAEGNDGAPVF